MRRALASVKIVIFFTTTLALYTLWLIGAVFVGRRRRWRSFIFRTWARVFADMLGMRVRVVGPIPQEPYFLVCNHTGYVDIPAIRCVLDGVFVAKSEISSWPVAGRVIRDMGNIFINRQNRRDIPRAGFEVKERLDAGEGVIVFPEGTSSDGKSVLPFNSSFLEFAAQSGLAVHYASLSYDTCDGDLPASRTVAWADMTPLGTHMRNLFAAKGFEATLTFGEEPVSTGDRKQLARDLHSAVERSFSPLD